MQSTILLLVGSFISLAIGVPMAQSTTQQKERAMSQEQVQRLRPFEAVIVRRWINC